MADTKISALAAATAALTTHEIPVNESGTTKRDTVAQIVTLLQTLGMPRVVGSLSAHSISSATATEVTQLGPMTLEAGTYQFTFSLICSAAVANTSGLRLGLNFTGTAAVRAFQMRYPSTGTAANTGIADDVGAATGQIHESNAQTAFSTTAPNMQLTGFVTAAARVLVVVEGTIVVTVAGDLELWHGSSGAVATTVDVGSSLSVVRVA